MSPGHVTVHACTGVDDFFEKLSWRGCLLKGTPPEQWLFRGHFNDEFRLESTALREGSSRLLECVPGLVEPTTNFEQVLGEASALDIFVRRADEAGLSLPEDSQQMRADLDVFKHIKGLNQMWPPPSLFSVLAMAQHHGLPTRLLDWTRNPLKAAFFAACKAAHLTPEEASVGSLSVWLFRTAQHHTLNEKGMAPFRIITAPPASNPNLRAQDGVFTAVVTVASNELVDRRTMDEVVKAAPSMPTPGFTVSKDTYEDWFHKVTLPRSLARQVLAELVREGITRARLYPDFYGVVKCMKDLRLVHENLYGKS